MNLAGKTYNIEEKTLILIMLCKIINEITNVPDKELLIPADTRT